MSRDTLRLLLSVAVLSALLLALAGRNLQEPGLYYDEVIQATPASEFLREGGQPLRIPGMRNIRFLGGWFPLMTQPYMGALKSQLLIPVFAVFGASPESLRLTTLVWACVGLLLATLWLREVYGLHVALVAAALLAFDPSFVFVSRHDWGSIALALAARGGGLWLTTLGWKRSSATLLVGGGLLLGIGLYNKIDLALFIAGCAVALLASAPRETWTWLRAHPGLAAAALAGLLAGSLPIWMALPAVLSATGSMFRSASVQPGDLAEKLFAWRSMLDGSYFHRLMLAGGGFPRLAAVEGAAWGPFGWIFAASFAGLAGHALAAARRGAPDRAAVFALVATATTALLLLATPRAGRIHHVMNVVPLPQLVVALAAARLATRGGAGRLLAALALAAVIAGNLAIDRRVLATLHETGGSGLWSNALDELARELPDDAVVVSLDWGFHAQLRFLRPALTLEEPFWGLIGRWAALRGGPSHVYLVQEPGRQVFDVGSRLVAALDALPPGSVAVRVHEDRTGAPAFRSIRFARPHELVYRESVEVRLQ